MGDRKDFWLAFVTMVKLMINGIVKQTQTGSYTYLEKHIRRINRWTFQKAVKTFGDIIEENKPSGITADTREFLFTMTPDIQKWTAETFFPRVMNAGCKKYALQVSADVFTQVSVEQTIEEDHQQSFITKYFEDPEKARDWLLE